MIARIRLYLAAAVAAALPALYWLGRLLGARNERARRQAQDNADYRDTRRRIDDADMGDNLDDDARRRRLRDFADKR